MAAEEENRRGRLSLSRRRKRGAAAAGSPAGAAKTPPITSFFGGRQPSTVACPLCGLPVPRSRINRHIDLQCENFERDGPGGPSGAGSPGRDPQRAPDPKGGEEPQETRTSPYFDKNSPQQVPREVCSGTVVRKLDLGSLASKLSRRCRPAAERTPKGGRGSEASPVPEMDQADSLESSQKENMVVSSSGNGEDCVTFTDLPGAENTSEPGAGPGAALKPLSSPSKPWKRQIEEEGTAGADASRKKAKLSRSDGGAGEAEASETLSASAEDLLSKTGDEDPRGGSPPPQRLPYYLRNFQSVLQAVLEEEDDRVLFSPEDMSHIHAFEKLSVAGQKLYVRLFQRKLKWLQISKLDYEEISRDLGPVAQELVGAGLLRTEADLQELGEALDLLPAPDLRALAKTFHLGASGTQKQHLVEGLLRLSKQKSFFSPTSANNSLGAVILRRVKQLAGSCVCLSGVPRAVFSRVLLLFSLTDTVEEEEAASGGQSQLYTILLVNSGRLAFPDYQVQRQAKVFLDRDDLIRYEASVRALQEVAVAMQAGRWEEALELYGAAKNTWKDLRENHDFSHQDQLPVFLRSFTPGWAYTRILSRGVEILQRLRRYQEAVEELRLLLRQQIYCPDSRGRWWDRLALNLHLHLKKPEQAIDAIRDGLADPLVRTGHKLSLHQRAVRMRESSGCRRLRLKLQDLPGFQVNDVKHVTIRGQLFPHEGGTGKNRFLIPAGGGGADGDGAAVICSVEELSLAHYRQQGFDQGIHGEGSTFSTFFALLLWDVIFMEGIPDVFRNPYQTCPLDLHTDCFYENRREAVDARVELLSGSSVEDLRSMLEEVWTAHQGQVCSCISWERFSSLGQAQSLVACMGGAFLAGVVARMAKDYRHGRGGLPDLVVWSTTDNTYKLVEVKGPNDRLSQKQQIWLDELQKLGADVEVCHVEATGARGPRLE